MKREFILCLLLFWAFVAAQAEPKNRKPNILFILTDDQRWDALGCYSKGAIRTPNLDRLAATGALLERFYAAAPLCCPSRSSFLTGLYPHQTGNYTNKGPYEINSKTAADYLNRAGYYTGFIGKSHLDGDPKVWGFKSNPVKFTGGNIGASKQIIVNGKKQRISGDITKMLVDAGIQFLEDHKKDTWFLWFATTAPHWPWIDDPKYAYQESEVRPLAGWPKTEEFLPGDWTGYYANVTMLDEQLGRLLNRLDELGLADNTFVFFVSDNGLMNHSHHETGKAIWFEEATRVPAIFRWPGKIKPNTRFSSFCSSVDLIPTLLDAAGKVPDQSLPGVSCLPPIIRGAPGVSTTFSEVATQKRDGYWRMIRNERWKYVQLFTAETQEGYLYDMREDPSEDQDLSKSDKNSSLLADLKGQMEKWIQKTQPMIPFRYTTKNKAVKKDKEKSGEAEED